MELEGSAPSALWNSPAAPCRSPLFRSSRPRFTWNSPASNRAWFSLILYLEIGRASWRERREFRRVLFRALELARGPLQIASFPQLQAALYVEFSGLESRLVQSDSVPGDRKSVVEGKTGVQTCALPSSGTRPRPPADRLFSAAPGRALRGILRPRIALGSV